MHYFIQLSPAIEKWILKASEESNIDLVALGLPKDLNKLKKITKSEGAEENVQLKNLCKALIAGNGKTIVTLSKWLNHLYNHHRDADINILKENV